ncbi:MAG: PDZ domain-containing protein [Acidobacteriota bacterium]|nr:PDZ domain-containing protein [Acidobacteriota bacterium]
MQPARPYRPKVSRETRLLLTAAAVAIAVLWLLARVRFQGLPDAPNPIPAVFSQLASPPRYDDLAGQLAQIQSRVQPSLLVIDAPAPAPASRSVAIKLRDDFVVSHLAPIAPVGPRKDVTVLAHDPASGLAVASSMAAASMSLPLPWTPRRLQQPRYFFATGVNAAGVSLYPVFVGSLTSIATPLWPDPVWAAPPGTPLVPGALLFTTDAELAGLVVALDGEAMIVPIALVLAEAERLLSVPPGAGGMVGVEVQALTPTIAAMTNANTGVVVTAVDAAGPGDGQLRVGDVIESAGGVALPTLQHWRVRVARLSAGETLALRVRRGGELHEVALVAAPSHTLESPLLGLALRASPPAGAEVVRVDRGSVADRAGLAVGDVITLIADVQAPSPAQVARVFNLTNEGQRVLIAVTRGDAHFVAALAR